jgi:HEAT repeat protein
MLADADPNARTGATIALAALNDPQVTRDLLQMFDDADQSVRIRAIDALSTLKDPQVSDALIEALHTSDPRVVLAALKRLTFRGEPAVVDALADLFSKHPDPEMRVECIHAMRARYSEKAHAARLAAFKDPNPNVRANAPRWIPRLSDNEGRRDFIDPIIQLATSDRETEVRLKAVDALGEMAEIAGLDTLLGALADQEPPVRLAAVNALGRLGDPRAVQPLVRLFDAAHGPAYDEYYWVGLDRPERYEAPPAHWPRLDIISALKRIATPEALEAAEDLKAKLGGAARPGG